MPDLALPDRVLDRARHIVNRHVRVDTVLMEQINGIGLDSLERRLRYLLDVLRPLCEPSVLEVGS
jgi:hypothetical protein